MASDARTGRKSHCAENKITEEMAHVTSLRRPRRRRWKPPTCGKVFGASALRREFHAMCHVSGLALLLPGPTEKLRYFCCHPYFYHCNVDSAPSVYHHIRHHKPCNHIHSSYSCEKDVLMLRSHATVSFPTVVFGLIRRGPSILKPPDFLLVLKVKCSYNSIPFSDKLY